MVRNLLGIPDIQTGIFSNVRPITQTEPRGKSLQDSHEQRLINIIHDENKYCLAR